MIGTGLGLLIGGLASAGASVGSAAMASHGATSAAETQAAAAQRAADLNAPYREAGIDALGKLQHMDAFKAPTDVTEQNDPGYQFRIKQAQQGFERSAAARGQLLSGGTLKALQRYTQDYASNEYANVYGRAASEYDRTATTYKQIAGMGQQATAAQGDLLTQGANATAAGQVGSANAYGGAISGIGNNLSFLSMLQAMNKPAASAPTWATSGQGNQFDPRAMKMNPWAPAGLPS